MSRARSQLLRLAHSGALPDNSAVSSLLMLGFFLLAWYLAWDFYSRGMYRRSFVSDRAPEPLTAKNAAADKKVENVSARDVVAMLLPEAGKSAVVKRRASDNNLYYIAADSPDPARGAAMFADVQDRAQKVLHNVYRKAHNGQRIVAGDGVDITDAMHRLLAKHHNKPLPLAEYHNPSDNTVGSNSDKGESFEICLRSKKDPNEWNLVNTLFRVLLHELAHSADAEYRADGEEKHGAVFKRLHMHLMGEAEELGLYSCAEYKASGGAFCGLKITENFCSG